MAIDLNKKYIRNENMVMRQIGAEVVLVPVVANAANVDRLYSLNSIGTEIWSKLDGTHTAAELIDYFLTVFEVERDSLQNDMHEFISDLLENRCIRKVED